MFNPLTPAQYVMAIGLAARDQARDEQAPGEFRRGQLMSAYSGSRHLAVELTWFGPELARFASRAADEVAATAAADPHDDALRELEAGLRGGDGPADVGRRVSELLEHLRAHPSPEYDGLRTRLQALLAELCDREVTLLAEAIEGDRR
jgi:hypothetical protein